MTPNIYTALFAALFVLHHGFEAVLATLQLRHLRARGDRVPKHLEGKVDLETIRKAVAYNQDKLRFGMVVALADAAALWVMIAVGFSWLDIMAAGFGGGPLVTGLLFFGGVSLLGALFNLPAALWATFVIEEKHGFNRQSLGAFFSDSLKALVINAALGGILIAIVLSLMTHGGAYWWLIAFGGVALFQLLVAWLYPVIIMPLFNKFTPVSEALREAVAALAERVGFPLANVYAMDGSRRSGHSNAFIVGLKGARKIVLYDTLIEKIDQPQLLAVLAHELGHFKLKHLTKRLVWMLAGLLLLFFGLSIARGLEPLYAGLGFQTVSSHAALVVFSLVISEMLAPVGWLMRIRSRKDETDADRFAVTATGNGEDLSEALIALNKQNLSSPGSHPLYRHYHNSHPALRERLRAIQSYAAELGQGA